MNLRFLNVGSAAVLAMTVTDIPLSRHGDLGEPKLGTDGAGCT